MDGNDFPAPLQIYFTSRHGRSKQVQSVLRSQYTGSFETRIISLPISEKLFSSVKSTVYWDVFF